MTDDLRTSRWSVDRPWAVVGLVAARVVVGTVVLLAAVQILAPGGYSFGYGEHTVLSLKGISWGDHAALVNDWFNDSAPQPHVLFDVVTWFGERIGHLDVVYFLYWTASLAVAALATVLLADLWLPRWRRPFEAVVLVLMVAGPYFALGTFLIIHREAVPNALGGALGYLAAALLIRGWVPAAIVVALLTTAVHVQHGVVVALLLAVTWLLSSDRRAVRFIPLAIAIIVAVTFLVSLARGLFQGNTDFAEICELASYGHCNPHQWPTPVIREGLLLLAIGAVAPLLAPARDRVAIAVVAAPALVVAVGLASDLWGVPLIGDLSRRLFVYRFVMVVAPFVGWTIVLLLVGARSSRARAVVGAVLGVGLLAWWLRAPYAAIPRMTGELVESRRLGLVLGAAACGLMVVGAVVARGRGREVLIRGTAAALASAVIVVGILWFGVRTWDQTPLRIGYAADDTAVVLAEQIRAATPVGAVIAVPPDLNWFPLLTRRAVVATCKNIPYGGEPWREYRARLAAQGVVDDYGRCDTAAWPTLGADDIAVLRDQFDATHILLFPGSVLYDVALAEWDVAWSGDGPAPWIIAAIPEAR